MKRSREKIVETIINMLRKNGWRVTVESVEDDYAEISFWDGETSTMVEISMNIKKPPVWKIQN